MKVVMISTMLPHGHYTEILTGGLQKVPDIDVRIYTSTKEKIPSGYPIQKVKNVWKPDIRYIFDILQELKHDRPDIVHLQHEFTMYGGIITSLLFPLLVLLLRLNGYPVVTTIHAVISPRQINEAFLSQFFIKKPFFINIFTFGLFLQYIYRLTQRFSSYTVCHTHRLKNVLTEEYGAHAKKVVVIETAIPEKKIREAPHKQYFLYYGYMIRRKGIEHVLYGLSEVVKKYPDWKLVMAGGVIPGQEQAFEEIKTYIQTYHLEKNVILKGYMNTETELEPLYAEATAVVLPAKTSIAASGPLYHAQGYHKCILASDIGNFKEEIIDGRNGILVKNDSWGQALIDLIEHPEKVTYIEQQVKQRADEKNPIQIAQRYLNLYHLL